MQKTMYKAIEPTPEGGDAVLLVSFGESYFPGQFGDLSVTTITIESPGNKEKIERPITERDTIRFAKQWKAYQERKENIVIGTPLSDLNLFDTLEVKLLESEKIYTLEQLAEVSDTACEKISKLREKREKAKKLLAINNGGINLASLELDKKVLQEQLAAMQEEITALRRLNGASADAKQDEKSRIAKENKIEVLSKSKNSSLSK